jgi:hypothetical protein
MGRHGSSEMAAAAVAQSSRLNGGGFGQWEMIGAPAVVSHGLDKHGRSRHCQCGFNTQCAHGGSAAPGSQSTPHAAVFSIFRNSQK